MRYSSISILVFSLFLPAATEGAGSVRPIDPVAAEILERALDRSPSVQALVRRLEASDVIAHVITSRELPAGVAGMTRFVTKSGGARYLRVTVSAMLPWHSRVAILAHELEHACEVAASTAGDAAGMKRLFESAGFRMDIAGEVFETTAAIRVEHAVRTELKERRTTVLEAEPVVKFDH